MSSFFWIVIACTAGGVLSVILAALLSLGASARHVTLLVSFAVGALLGAVFLEILPYAFARTAEASTVTALEIAKRFEDAGVAAIIFTDIARDGMLKGLNLDATIALADKISIPVIASGGFASIEDVKALLAPRAKKLEGAISGRALYDGRVDPAEALTLIRNARAAA